MFVLVTWREQDVDSFFTSVFALVTWRWTGCGLILVLSVCVGDLEMNSLWIGSCP